MQQAEYLLAELFNANFNLKNPAASLVHYLSTHLKKIKSRTITAKQPKTV